MQVTSPSLLLSKTTKTKSLFIKLFTSQPNPNPTPISFYFSLLDSSPSFLHLRHLHGHLLRHTPLYTNVILTSKLVLSYSNLNRLTSHALSLFCHMPQRNIYSWNIIIGQFSRSTYPHTSIDLFLQMQKESDVKPDDFTLPLVLRACPASGQEALGVTIHGLGLKLGYEGSLYVISSLVCMYVKLGRMFDARKVFDEMPVRDSVLWTAMFGGYVQQGEPVMGLELFREMSISGFKLDWVVMVNLLLACGQLNWLKHGKSVHGWYTRRLSETDVSLGNAMVDMYVKCSKLSYAYKVFDKMPQRDVISWSTLVSGYSLSGDVGIALKLFDDMIEDGIKPNEVTFLGVLSACAHGGLVAKARSYLKLMNEHDIKPELKHYASMVDCLSRAGLLEEAERFIEEMPVEVDEAVLGAVLSGCRVYNNVEVGERVAKKLIEMEPEKAGYYVTLAGLYAGAGRFDEAETVRELMKDKNVSKVPGCSLI